MSGHFVSVVMTGLKGVDPSAKLVAVALADCANANHGGVAFPSIGTLVARTGICETQVRVHLRRLETDGWIAREGSANGGRGMTTRYRLNLARMLTVSEAAKAAPNRRVSEVKGDSAPPGIADRNPAVHRTKPGSAVSETRRSTAENSVPHRPRTGSEPSLTGIEPRARAPAVSIGPKTPPQIVTPFRGTLRGEPEQRRQMTAAEQIDYCNRHIEKGGK